MSHTLGLLPFRMPFLENRSESSTTYVQGVSLEDTLIRCPCWLSARLPHDLLQVKYSPRARTALTLCVRVVGAGQIRLGCSHWQPLIF